MTRVMIIGMSSKVCSCRVPEIPWTIFPDAIRASPLIAPSEMGDWIADVELGDEEPILALIVLRFTQLETFELGLYFSGVGGYLLQTLKRITKASEAAIHPGQSAGICGIRKNTEVGLPRPRTLSNVGDMTLNFVDIEIGRTLPTAAEHEGTEELQLLWKYRLSLSSLFNFAMN